MSEEARLLRALPAYGDEVADVVRAVKRRQAEVVARGRDEVPADVFGVRYAGLRRLRRLRRRHRAEVTPFEMQRWASFIGPLLNDARPGVRAVAKRAAKAGLGSANIARLVEEGDRLVVRSFRARNRKLHWI